MFCCWHTKAINYDKTMKALELAVKQEVYVGGTLGRETASELRRLAELNAEIFAMLEFIYERVNKVGVDPFALNKLADAIYKLKVGAT